MGRNRYIPAIRRSGEVAERLITLVSKSGQPYLTGQKQIINQHFKFFNFFVLNLHMSYTLFKVNGGK